jgi:hypothetical protein
MYLWYWVEFVEIFTQFNRAVNWLMLSINLQTNTDINGQGCWHYQDLELLKIHNINKRQQGKNTPPAGMKWTELVLDNNHWPAFVMPMIDFQVTLKGILRIKKKKKTDSSRKILLMAACSQSFSQQVSSQSDIQLFSQQVNLPNIQSESQQSVTQSFI